MYFIKCVELVSVTNNISRIVRKVLFQKLCSVKQNSSSEELSGDSTHFSWMLQGGSLKLMESVMLSEA